MILVVKNRGLIAIPATVVVGAVAIAVFAPVGMAHVVVLGYAIVVVAVAITTIVVSAATK